MSSRSRSRSGSRSPKRSHRRNIRDESISPIRTASGASLRTPKQYDSRNQGYRNNYQNYNNYGQRNNYNNYNNRGNYNQRYNNNYGNRWNRGGRGNYNRGGFQNWNQGNHQGRSRYNSRSDRSRSRSKSRSYDRDQSRSRSGSRSQSRSRDRRRRRRSPSYHSSGKSRSASRSRSKSKTPTKVAKPQIKEATNEKETKILEPSQMDESDVKPPGEDDDNAKPVVEKKPEVKQPAFAESSAFTRSRWETPDSSPVRQGGKSNADIDLQQDKIFDQWDDDKLRAYLLKSKGKKLGKDKDGKKLTEGTQAQPSTAQESSKPKKKKRSKSNAESPAKETRGRKKKRSNKASRASPSSSSSSWSPIHKAHNPDNEVKNGNENDNQQTNDVVAPGTNENQYGVVGASSKIYSQREAYSISTERTQAVQYPFSHIRQPVTATQPTPQVSQQSFPAPVPPPQNQQPTAVPAMGEMQIIGPDGTPVTLVPTSVMGPDGKMMQVMQIKPTASLPPVSVPPVSQPKLNYRAPPPPPSYPPPVPQTDPGKYFSQSSAPVSSAPSTTCYHQADSQQFSQEVNERQSYGKANISNGNLDMPDHVKDLENVVDKPYEVSDHTTGLKKMEKAEKQKRRQEVLRTRFKPRAASTWAQEVNQDKKEEKTKPSQMTEEPQPIPRLGDNSVTKMNKPAKQEFKLHEEHKIKTITSDSSAWKSQSQNIPVMSGPVPAPQIPAKIEPPIIVQSQQTQVVDANVEKEQTYSNIPSQLAAQGFKSVYGNPQLVMGPNGEMLQLISAPQTMPVVSQSPAPVPSTVYPRVTQPKSNQDKYWSNDKKKTEAVDVKKEESSSSDEEEMPVVVPPRKRNTSSGNEKKSKKKTKSNRSVSTEKADDDDDEEEVTTTKRKKESKKKKKKNKKKKEEVDDDEAPVKEKKKKKEKKQKEKPEFDPLEHETLKSKKDLKGLQEVKKKSKKDELARNIAEDLSLSHVRGIVPRRKGEPFHALLKHVDFETRTKSSLAPSTSYEERFVSLFGSGDAEPPSAPVEEESKIDITKKSVRKFKVHMKGTRDVTHMTRVSLSERINDRSEDSTEKTSSQQVSLNVSSLSKQSHDTKSVSRSPSQSSSASSGSRNVSKKRRKSYTRSRSSSLSNSRSRSRSASLPLAYSGKPSRREVIPPKRYRSGSRDYSDDDKRGERGSRSRSHSYSPDSRNRGQRQPYYNRNNQQQFYNNRGRGQYNNRGYYQNYNRGWGRYNNNYQNRGNFRGRFQNWNNQGGYNNRNQNYHYNRYDNRDDRSRDSRRDRSSERSPDRSRNRDDRSSSRERDNRKDNKHDGKTPTREKKTVEEQTPKKDEKNSETPSNQTKQANVIKQQKKSSPAQWGHDMFDDQEEEKAE